MLVSQSLAVKWNAGMPSIICALEGTNHKPALPAKTEHGSLPYHTLSSLRKDTEYGYDGYIVSTVRPVHDLFIAKHSPAQRTFFHNDGFACGQGRASCCHAAKAGPNTQGIDCRTVYTSPRLMWISVCSHTRQRDWRRSHYARCLFIKWLQEYRFTCPCPKEN